MKNVIVTGGSGLLGASLVHELIKDGEYKPVVMDIVDNPKRINDILDKIEYVQGDISHPDMLNETFAKYKPVKIYHIAAFLGDMCENDPLGAVKVNID